MTNDDKTTPDFEAVSIDVNSLSDEEREELEDDEDGVTAMWLAGKLMDTYGPSFTVVASPNMYMTPKGFMYPAEIGIAVNPTLAVTKSVLASILREIADMLDEDINKVMNFVQEATGNNADD